MKLSFTNIFFKKEAGTHLDTTWGKSKELMQGPLKGFLYHEEEPWAGG